MSAHFHGQQIVMPYEQAHAIVQHARKQASMIVALQERLAERENVLMLALHELAILRQEREPQFFMYRRSRKIPLHRDKRFVDKNGGGPTTA